MVSSYGSSPRVRGTQSSPVLKARKVRIIPARAGNTLPHDSSNAPSPDHPRACGEHLQQCKYTSCGSGSSPRVRGTQAPLFDKPGGERIIPARAGNTGAPTHPKATRPDHPRACGEHISMSMLDCCSIGSSPRVRGTHAARRMPIRLARIIPARAGNTMASSTRASSTADHPRACGEHVV